jgi:hypothetical protein
MATAGFITDDDNDDAPHAITHQGPVIDTTQFQLVSHDNGTTTISGVQFTDTDPSAPSEIFTLVAAAKNGSILPAASGSGSLQDMEAALDSITYSPGAHPPQTDKVTLTVIDAFGDSDTVHFVFNQAGAPASSGSPIVLQGTSGKDVIFGTGYGDSLTGGGGQDQFVFQPTSGHDKVQHTITDFDVVHDRIDLRDFSGIDTANIDQWLAQNAVQQGKDTLLALDHNDSILLKNVHASSLHASDFIVSLHGGAGV